MVMEQLTIHLFGVQVLYALSIFVSVAMRRAHNDAWKAWGLGEFSVAHLNVSCPRGQLSSVTKRFDVQRISGRQDSSWGEIVRPRVTSVAVHGSRRWLPKKGLVSRLH